MSYTRNGYTYGNGWGRPATEGEMALEAAQRIEDAMERSSTNSNEFRLRSIYWADKAAERAEVIRLAVEMLERGDPTDTVVALLRGVLS